MNDSKNRHEVQPHNIYWTVPGFVDHIYFRQLSELLQSTNFEWYYNNNISYKTKGGPPISPVGELGNYGYSHWFYKTADPEGWTDSPHTNLLRPLFYKIQSFLQANKILSARADMVTRKGNEEYALPPHIDFDYSHIATILYMNKTDGDTIWYRDSEGKNEVARISPEPNTLVCFSGNVWHTGCLPNKHNQRILINSNYLL